MLVCRSWPGRGARMRSTSSIVRPQSVLDHALCTGFAAQPLVVSELETFLADVVDAGEPEQVTSDLAAGVVAPVFPQQVHARDAEVADSLRVVRAHVAHEIDEFAVEAARHAPSEPLWITVERLGEPHELLRRLRELGGVGPDRIHRRAHRERVAVAVEDHAAVGRELCDAGEARIALLLEKALVDDLQVDRACDQHDPPRERAARGAGVRASGPVPRPLPFSIGASWLDDAQVRGARDEHLEIVACDAFHAAVRTPGALLELQLPPLDVELVALHGQALQLDELSSRLVLPVDDGERRRENGDPEHADRDPPDAHASGTI